MTRGKVGGVLALALTLASCAASKADDPDAGDLDPIDAAERPSRPDAPPGTAMATFDFTGQTETFTVPAAVVSITIEAFGAQGGGGIVPTAPGGLGASVQGTFVVAPGDTIQILVGEQGVAGVPNSGSSDGQEGGTGGGGTFVVSSSNEPLVIAGGGGGATSSSISGDHFAGGPGQTVEAGQAGSGGNAGTGGVDGGGGVSGFNIGYHSGTGGGGFLTNGIGATTEANTVDYGTPNLPGASYQNGAAGGVGGSQGRNGGLGGGGSAGFTGGGGGGYSGGGGGSLVAPVTYGGGGGGSFNAGTDPEAEEGVHSGNGQVVITW